MYPGVSCVDSRPHQHPGNSRDTGHTSRAVRQRQLTGTNRCVPSFCSFAASNLSALFLHVLFSVLWAGIYMTHLVTHSVATLHVKFLHHARVPRPIVFGLCAFAMAFADMCMLPCCLHRAMTHRRHTFSFVLMMIGSLAVVNPGMLVLIYT